MRARLQDLRGDRFAEPDPFRLVGAVGNCAEIGGERGFHFGLHLRIDAGEHRAGGRRSRGFLETVAAAGAAPGKAGSGVRSN